MREVPGDAEDLQINSTQTTSYEKPTRTVRKEFSNPPGCVYVNANEFNKMGRNISPSYFYSRETNKKKHGARVIRL
jgi:hypothetical protein